jgi:hypothetical protein
MYRLQVRTSFVTGVLTFINIILILSTISVAQDTWTDTKTHFQVGAGISTFGATVHLGFHYRPNHQGLNIRYLSSYTYRDAPFGSTNSAFGCKRCVGYWFSIDVVNTWICKFKSNFVSSGGVNLISVEATSSIGIHMKLAKNRTSVA